MMFLLSRLRLPLLLMALSIAACGPSQRFLAGSQTAHERYRDGLESAGLAASVLGRQWTTAASGALTRPAVVSLPHSEAGFFAPAVPRAVGLRFTAPKGQRIRIALAARPDTGARLFAELWQLPGGREPHLLRSLDRLADTLEYDVQADGEQLVLRLQPELLAALSYTLSVTSVPSLGFPVQGGKSKDIGSLWGDPRDAGARRHEGIDIFGKKRTPVVAAAGGTVSRVQETGLGGKVVWLRPDGLDLSLYYAHLDSQLVQPGQAIRAGAVLGLMGNTGNARNTATHLHFGIYGDGSAVNPYYYVAGGSGPAPVPGAPPRSDSLLRTARATPLVAQPGGTGGTTLAAGTALAALASSGTQYRVVLPDGRTGWVPRAAVQAPDKSLRQVRLDAARPLLHVPVPGAAEIDRLAAGSTFRVTATWDDWVYGTADGRTGWLQEL